MISEIRCEWCGRLFLRPHGSGPPPKFCSIGHRQRASEQRRIDRAVAAAILTLRQDERGPVASPSTLNPTSTKGPT